MSSIDKYVETEAESCDPRVRVRTEGGRIRGYIDGELVFDINDRVGYLSENERRIIRESVARYQADEARRREEERRRRIEEERRRLEAERQAALRKLKDAVESKKPFVKANKSAVEKAYSIKVKEIEALQASIDEVKRLFPSGNVDALTSKKNEALSVIRTKFESLLNELREQENLINRFSNQINDNMSIEQINRLMSEVNKVKIKNIKDNVEYDSSSILEEVKIVKKNVVALKSLVEDAKIIEDEFVREQLQLELSGIDLCNKLALRSAMNQITSRIEKYRLTLLNIETDKKIRELNKIEALAATIKEISEYNAVDTYVVSQLDLKIVEEAKDLVEKINELAQLEYNVLDFDISTTLEELLEVISTPKDTTEQKEAIKRVAIKVSLAEDLAKQYQAQYEVYQELLKELKELGVSYVEPFNCKDYVSQFVDMEDLMIKKYEEQEQMVLESTSFNVIDKMFKTGYELFKQEGNDSYQELYFVNRQYPGVLTRILIDTTGGFRRSLVVVKTGEEVTSPEDALKMSIPMETDVARFLHMLKENGENLKFGSHMVSYTSPNAIQEILDNGYVELTGEAAEAFNKIFEEEAKKNPAKSYKVNKIPADKMKECKSKEEIAKAISKSKSHQMKQKRKKR